MAEATHELISNNDLNKAIEKAMRSLGKGINADGINIYTIRRNDSDNMVYVDSFMRWLQTTDEVDFKSPVYYDARLMPNAFIANLH